MIMSKALHCSFCGKNQDDVSKLVAGPGRIFICNQCTDLCHDIVHEADRATKKSTVIMANEPGSYGCHEAFSITYLLRELLDEHLSNHPAIRQNPQWTELIETAGDALNRLYHRLGSEHLAVKPNEPQARAGWAEGVTKDEEGGDGDVAFAFTCCGTELTGLPVDVWVGDDAPLVIAGPENLPEAHLAAIRHWVVKHQDALTAHWREVISSVELIKVLRGPPPEAEAPHTS
jgi:hypothetical protein